MATLIFILGTTIFAAILFYGLYKALDSQQTINDFTCPKCMQKGCKEDLRERGYDV